MDLLLIVIILTFSYMLVRKRQQTIKWSKKKVRILFGLFNSLGLFLGLLLLELLFYSYLQLELGFIIAIALVALLYGLIVFSLSFIKFNTHGEKKNIFDDNFVPQRDIEILNRGKEIFKLEAITIIIVLLPLLAIFITLYFLER
ncbi:hypothetical protein IM538_07640 [Cytobacillus suaedae]|nr:hypothetical protein IM538_07640 [Cytobacillus suaedae]